LNIDRPALWRAGRSGSGTWRRLAAGWLGALAVILAVTGVMERQAKPLSLSSFDQPFYLGIAYDLRATGRFTNGFMFDVHGPAALRGPGMRFSPLYPALLAAVAAVDPVLRQGMACVVETSDQPEACQSAAPVMRVIQFAMLAGFFLLVWWIGGQVGGSLGMAWLTLAIGLVAAPTLLRSVNLLMTEMTSLLFATAAIAAWLQARRSARPAAWAAVAGGLLGLAALTRPGFLYLLPVCVLAALALAAARRREAKGWWRAAAMMGGGVVVLAPWIMRNWLVFDRAKLTYGYDSHTLVQRIAFDTMSWREYGLAYLCWLPDGTSLGRHFVGSGACDRFGWDEQPNSFYSLGLRHMLDQTLKAAGGYDHHLSYLLHHYILVMPLWHLAVSVPLALRGAYVSHWWGLVLLPVCLWFSVRAVWRGDDRYLAVALPALVLLAFNANVAVNQARYNLLLVPAFAVAGALCLRAAAAGWHDAQERRNGLARA
jgi:4-amino-4-deoxy-L-arabinose transferase-like glycosyltransferase